MGQNHSTNRQVPQNGRNSATAFDRITDALETLLASGREAQIYTEASAAVLTSNAAHLAAVPVRSSQAAQSSTDSYFDVASLTKLFTAAACLRLVDRGVLGLEAPISRYLEDLSTSPSGHATLEELLRHQAGFAPWRPFFEQIPRERRGTRAGADAMRSAMMAHPPTAAPGRVQYSDIGFVILGYLLEKAADSRLEMVIASEVTGPLELEGIHFRPLSSAVSAPAATIAPTEACPWRGYRLRGEVHDDNAWSMGGVAGHAGLFARAGEVAAFGSAWLNALDGRGWISESLARRATRPHPAGRGLGFDFISKPTSSAGSRISDDSFGHLGFTGCSLWIDPVRKLSVALLTNRVYFGRDNQKIRAFRPYFHDRILVRADAAR